MIDWFVSYIIRLFFGGLICMFISLVSSKGSFSEPIRLCLACFMLILILTPIRGHENLIVNLGEYISSVRSEMEYTVLNALEDQKNMIGETSSHKLKDILHSEGLECSIEAEIGDDSEVRQIIIYGDRGQAEKLIRKISVLTGLGEDYIYFREDRKIEG